MRYVPLKRLRQAITPEWEEKAREAYEKAKAAGTEKERAETINSCRDVWISLKEALQKVADDKCWYCESSAHRMFGDVDHFRPKNQIKPYPPDPTQPKLPGYWWLAFCWSNYRYSCERCNRPRKGSHFPLLDLTKRICNECDYEDLLAEESVLLDPTDPDDPALLTFDRNGKALPAYDKEECPEEYQRADTSIILYDLNHRDLIDQRREEICDRVRELVRKMDWNSAKWKESNKNDVAARNAMREAATELKKMIHESAEYSAAAYAVLKSFWTPKREWIGRLLAS
ncbi:MAG TPA: hypothetical protein VEL31_23920 [Ktedonobacteraceae bacterium]|nr:hypothetical protein [Ktedonobacteraceae bacterium]